MTQLSPFATVLLVGSIAPMSYPTGMHRALLVCMAGLGVAANLDTPYAVGDAVLSKISYKSKTGTGQVITGERGRITQIDATKAAMYAICEFPRWPSAKLKIKDLARIGDAALDGWKIGDEIIVSGVQHDDGEYGTVKSGDSGVVLGAWDDAIQCKFSGLRKKVLVQPKLLHLKMSSKPVELLGALFVAAFLGVPAILALSRFLSGIVEWLHKLPGGYQLSDQVISLHEVSFLGLKVGDIGWVVGRSRSEPSQRIRCRFASGLTVDIPITLIAKRGEQLLGSFCAGDVVVSNISVTLGNGQILAQGTKGKALKLAGGDGERMLCGFQEPAGVLIGVGLSDVQCKQRYLHDMKKSRTVSVEIKKEQRRLQKAVIKARLVQEQEAAEDEEVTARQAEEQEPVEDEEVDDSFLCNLCDDLLCEPVTLVCGHTMCKCCVEAWKEVCRHPFKSPCCAQVVPYELTERTDMHRDIEHLYPLTLAKRIAQKSERRSEPPANVGDEACNMPIEL